MIDEKIFADPNLRKAMAIESFPHFVSFYFPEHISYLNAPMHNEMYNIAADEVTKLSAITAFRGSAKSTIFSLLYPIWAVLGKQQKKYVIIASNTQKLASTHFGNIKRSLEGNKLLRQDFALVKGIDWNKEHIIVWPNNAKIMSASLEQSVRGYRHDQYRPDLIIVDDIEDLESVKTQEGRDKTEQWFTGDVIPSGDKNTKIVVVGNLLHEDSLLMRLKDQIINSSRPGRYVEFPIVDEDGNSTWPAKYPDKDAIEDARAALGNDISWFREYELKIVNPDGMLFRPEWLLYYDELPEGRPTHVLHGVDLAISTKASADYTAVVSLLVYGSYENTKIFVLPNPFNRRMDFPDAVEEIRSIYVATPGKLCVESVGYQKSMIEQLIKRGCHAVEAKTQGQDKRSRAVLITPHVRNGTIKFPEKGCEKLIRQMVHFGVEKHDDLLDAFVYAATEATKRMYTKARCFPKPPGW